MKKSDDIAEVLNGRKKPGIPSRNFLSTGSTLLNLACSGSVDGGFAKGLCHLIVGDSNSGKTFLSMTCFAEAARNKRFKNYRFILDSAEHGALMDVAGFFGLEVARRLECPRVDDDGGEIHSETVEDFYYHVDDALKAGKPFIYVLDSLDALTTGDEEEQFTKEKKKARGVINREISGSYGTSKAKKNSQYLRVVTNGIKKSGSILILICQTRDNIGFGAKFHPKTRSGGNAPRFYSRIELWLSVKERLKAKVNGKDFQNGIVTRIKVEKNHICGWEGSVLVPIYRNFGIDDLGSCVDYLTEHKHWKERGRGVEAPELGECLPREELIHYVEENELEDLLRQTVQQVWDRVESESTVKRKPRYQ